MPLTTAQWWFYFPHGSCPLPRRLLLPEIQCFKAERGKHQLLTGYK